MDSLRSSGVEVSLLVAGLYKKIEPGVFKSQALLHLANDVHEVLFQGPLSSVGSINEPLRRMISNGELEMVCIPYSTKKCLMLSRSGLKALKYIVRSADGEKYLNKYESYSDPGVRRKVGIIKLCLCSTFH